MTMIEKRVPWKAQVADGRAFELRSKSKNYPPPCALVINAMAHERGDRMCVGIDQHGVIGDGIYRRSHNLRIFVEGMRIDQFTSARVRCRRPDLERFGADDLELIRYGLALDFNGCIHDRYNDPGVPTVVPSKWTVFWLAAFELYDYRICEVRNHKELLRLLSGAWHFNSFGGCRHLGYKFGHAWGTRHLGARLEEIRNFFRSHLPDIREQQINVIRGKDGQNAIEGYSKIECPVVRI